MCSQYGSQFICRRTVKIKWKWSKKMKGAHVDLLCVRDRKNYGRVLHLEIMIDINFGVRFSEKTKLNVKPHQAWWKCRFKKDTEVTCRDIYRCFYSLLCCAICCCFLLKMFEGIITYAAWLAYTGVIQVKSIWSRLVTGS